jgi:uncharacterized protein
MSERELAIVDTGPVLAAIDPGDANHQRCSRLLERTDLRFVVPLLTIGEVLYFIGKYLGPTVEIAYLRSLQRFRLEPPIDEDWNRVAGLVETYRDFPLGGVDASIVALNTDLVITLDRRHFSAIRPRHVAAFRILPD